MAENPLHRYANDFVAFAGDMVVQLGGRFGRFADHWDAEQQTLVGKLAPSVHAVLRGDIPPTSRFYVSATKGYGKDQIATLLLLFVLLFARRPTRAQLIANKLSQANEPLDILRGILWADGPINRLAAQVVELQSYRVVSHRGTTRPESVIEVLASDRQAHGSRPDILVCNEVSHIEDEFHFRTADDNLAKCPHGLGLYLSNAGYIGTWQHGWHERVLADPLFDCTIIKHPAPWIDPKVLASKAKTDIPARHRMYYYGEWVSPLGDCLPRQQIEDAVAWGHADVVPRHPYICVAAADLSTTVNRSGFVILGVAPDHPIALVEARSWKPKEYIDHREFVKTLREEIGELCRQHGVRILAFDQHQSALLVDVCAALGIPTFPYYAGAKDFDEVKNNATMRAEVLFRSFSEGWVRLYRQEQLLLDLKATSIVTKAGGSKLEFAGDSEGGHGDLADSFATALLLAWNEQRAQRFNVLHYGSIDGPREECLLA
ncbi:MAG: hypothetical protein IT425_02645 [Pirellulales bacterium]|nr:hypothetical protein [Pirellulales bacterium]